jgi:hypothetical protein
MCGRMVRILALATVMSLVVDAGAAVLRWNGSTDEFWSTPGNWENNTVPSAVDTAMINVLPGPTVANEGAVANQMWLGEGGSDGGLIVDGGMLTVNTWLFAQIGAQGEVIVNVVSGNINVTVGGVGVGMRGPATLNMTGGTITCPGFLIGLESGSSGMVNLDGGTVTCGYFTIARDSGSAGSMDVQAGTLIVDGNAVDTIQGYIDSGWITAYDGHGSLELDYDITNKGQTTLRAVHDLNPLPRDGGLTSPGATELSWTLPDPCVPGQTVLVDVYFTDDLDALLDFTNPDAIRVVGGQAADSVVVQTEPKTRYYWAVDTYIGSPDDPILGPIFSFIADNRTPEVNAGADVVSWLDGGVRTRNLDATVIDDGAIQPYTVQWTVVSEPDDPDSPDAVVADPTAEDTSITMSAVGEYVLQLDAFDGEYTGSDTITLYVYTDSCTAAQALPDYEPLVGDLNGDCKVDDMDMALLQDSWLEDISLTEEVELD